MYETLLIIIITNSSSIIMNPLIPYYIYILLY